MIDCTELFGTRMSAPVKEVSPFQIIALRTAASALGTAGADIIRPVGEAGHLDHVPRARSLDVLAVSDVDADMVDALHARAEEDEVSRHEGLVGDVHALVVLAAREVRQMDADLLLAVHRETGAVEARG